MLNDLLKYISSKDFVSAKAVMESLLKEKIASTLEEKRLSVVDEMFNTKELTLEDYSLEELEAFVESEEYAQLDELSKATLGSYIKKSAQHRTRLAVAGKDLENKSDAISKAKHGIEDNETYNSLAKAATNLDKQRHKVQDKDYNRAAGIRRAVARLTKEEVEQIDELSKTTLGNYIKKATIGTRGVAASAYEAGQKSGTDAGGKAFSKAMKRIKGVEKATDRLTKEEVEIDEAVKVSSSSKQNYEWSNGKKPSGHGRWMFSTIEPRKHDVRNDEHMKNTYTSSFASFSDASKEAAKHFKAAGHVGDIHVLS